ncbi:MAG TPA: hypothetical protein VIM93_00250 [Kangiella sp.]
MFKKFNSFAASITGSVSGAIASVVSVSKAGVVSGLGATGITSGLSSIGSVAGGGMAAGLGVVVAIPVVVGGVSYCIYKYCFSDE